MRSGSNFWRALFAAAILACLLAIRCGSTSNESSSPSAPSQPTPSGNQLTVTPTSLAFGNVVVGSAVTQSVQLSNPGGSTMTISIITANSSSFSMTGLSTPLNLASGQNVTLTVRFAPTTSGTASGAVSVSYSGTSSPLTVTVSGTGIATGAHSLNLAWTASTSEVIGYNVYRSDRSGGPYTRLNSATVPGTLYTDPSVASGMTYYYVVTAIGTNNMESGLSNETAAAVPKP